MLQSSFLLVQRNRERLRLQIPVIPLLPPHGSSAAKPLVTSSGPSLTLVLFLLSINFLSHPQIPPTFLFSKYQSQIQMLLSGACFTLPMLVTIYHLNVLNLAKYRRTPRVQTEAALASVSQGNHQKKKLFGRLLGRVTKIALNGSSSVQLSISSSSFSHVHYFIECS